MNRKEKNHVAAVEVVKNLYGKGFDEEVAIIEALIKAQEDTIERLNLQIGAGNRLLVKMKRRISDLKYDLIRMGGKK